MTASRMVWFEFKFSAAPVWVVALGPARQVDCMPKASANRLLSQDFHRSGTSKFREKSLKTAALRFAIDAGL
jgi:hypothetical protein